jgi:hypothetical protein
MCHVHLLNDGRFTPMNKVWNMVQKIKGKYNKTNVHHLKDGHDTLTSEQDISNKSNRRSAFLRFFDDIFALIIKPWFSWVFWICRGFWYSLISY